MKFEQIIKANVEPVLSSHGYILVKADKSAAVFTNINNSIRTKFLLSKRPPAQLLLLYKEEILKKNQLLLPLCLQIEFFIKAGAKWINILPELFLQSDVPLSRIIHNNYELGKAAVEISINALTHVFPYLNELETRVVFPTEEMYTALSESPQIKAKNFAAKHNVSICSTREVLKFLQNYLDSILPNNQLDYTQKFQSILSEFIDIAAFAGEAIISNEQGSWRWFRLSAAPSQFTDRFAIALKNTSSSVGDSDPLYNVLDHWNFGADFKPSGLYCIEFTQYFQR